jgi:ABC-type lipoprotein release transport system permease subunit
MPSARSERDQQELRQTYTMYFRMGWRNIWRNPRRTAVILIAILTGVWSMIFLGALMRGIADQMVRNGIDTLTGHIQVHRAGYRNDPSIEKSIKDTKAVEGAFHKVLPGSARTTTRIRVNAVMSNARHSIGVTLVGIQPKQEAAISFIGHAVKEGAYLRTDDMYGILIGKALVEDFETKLGHKVVLMSQDSSGEIASRAFRIAGIFRAELEATEKRFVFVTMAAAREMLKIDGISEASILLPSQGDATRVASDLRSELPAEAYDVQTWRQLLPMVTAVLELYDGFIFLWFIVVFVAMAFGIVNTILMAVFERIREFGLLKALGMKPSGILRQVVTESVMLLTVGLLGGNMLGYLTVLFLSRTGIDLTFAGKGMEYVGMSRIIYPVIHGRDLMLANLVVIGLGIVVSLYPAIKAAKFKPVEALART